MAASDALLNQALDAVSGTAATVNYVAFASCHTAAPNNAGSNEYAGVTRQAETWNAGSTHAKTNAGALSFTTSGSTAVTDIGTWTLVSAGVFGIGIHLSSSVTATTITVAAGALNLAGSAV